MPEEYYEYLLCKTFGKFPSEIEAQPARDMNRLLVIMAVEAEVRNANSGG